MCLNFIFYPMWHCMRLASPFLINNLLKTAAIKVQISNNLCKGFISKNETYSKSIWNVIKK
jgi:hypothetical protein